MTNSFIDMDVQWCAATDVSGKINTAFAFVVKRRCWEASCPTCHLRTQRFCSPLWQCFAHVQSIPWGKSQETAPRSGRDITVAPKHRKTTAESGPVFLRTALLPVRFGIESLVKLDKQEFQSLKATATAHALSCNRFASLASQGSQFEWKHHAEQSELSTCRSELANHSSSSSSSSCACFALCWRAEAERQMS